MSAADPNILPPETAETADVTFVYGHDWAGMYVNGKLVMEDHRISAGWAVELLLGKHITSIDSFSCDENWLEWRGKFPDSLDDVVKHQ